MQEVCDCTYLVRILVCTVDSLIAIFYRAISYNYDYLLCLIRGTTMSSWKGYSKRQKIQLAILFIIWGLFGLVVITLSTSNVFNQIEYIYGLIAWTLLTGICAVVSWFILKKR